MPLIDSPVSPLVPQLKGLHLFHYDGAPCAQRVRFALGEKGLLRGREVKFDASTPATLQGEADKWVSRVVSLVKKDHMTEAYAKIHPNMVVPALVHDGRLYLESMDIIEYLDNTFGGSPLIPVEANQREYCVGLVERAKEAHLAIRYVTFHWGLGRLAMLNPKERESLTALTAVGNDGENLVQFYEGYSTGSIPESVYEGHLMRLYEAFNDLEDVLRDDRPFLVGQALTMADAFWSMKVLRLIETGYPFADHHPLVLRWFESIEQRPAFQQGVMGKHRLMSRLFRLKAGLEARFGQGLEQALNRLLNA